MYFREKYYSQIIIPIQMGDKKVVPSVDCISAPPSMINLEGLR